MSGFPGISETNNSVDINGPHRSQFAALEAMVKWVETEVNTSDQKLATLVTDYKQLIEKMQSKLENLKQENEQKEKDLVQSRILIEDLRKYNEEQKLNLGIVKRVDMFEFTDDELSSLRKDMDKLFKNQSSDVSVSQSVISELHPAMTSDSNKALVDIIKEKDSIIQKLKEDLQTIRLFKKHSDKKFMKFVSERFPAIPSNVTVRNDTGGVILSWDAADVMEGISEYGIWRGLKTNGNDSTISYCEVGRTTASSIFIDCSSFVRQEVFFRIYAIDDQNRNSPLTPIISSVIQKPIVLSFESNFDDRGLFYFLGTAAGNRSYLNPHNAGDVRVSFSSVAQDPTYSALHKFVGRIDDGHCCTDNKPNSWMAIDIGVGRKLLPTFYSLKNDRLGTYHALRNWELQGRVSKPGEWVTLRRHVNDDTLAQQSFATASWSIQLDQRRSFRYFRILQFDVNAYGAHNIMCCGIELYGELFSENESENNFSSPGKLRPSNNNAVTNDTLTTTSTTTTSTDGSSLTPSIVTTTELLKRLSSTDRTRNPQRE